MKIININKYAIVLLIIILISAPFTIAQIFSGEKPATPPPPVGISVEEKKTTDEVGKEKVEFVITATCGDKIKNQGEEGVDCGGPCLPCKEFPLLYVVIAAAIIVIGIIIYLKRKKQYE